MMCFCVLPSLLNGFEISFCPAYTSRNLKSILCFSVVQWKLDYT